MRGYIAVNSTRVLTAAVKIVGTEAFYQIYCVMMITMNKATLCIEKLSQRTRQSLFLMYDTQKTESKTSVLETLF